VVDNKTLILQEFDKLKGQFIITMMYKVERLVAIAEDDMDYYYITYNGRKLTWNTCVGSIIPLKGYIKDEYYNEFERMSDLNDYDKLLGKDGIEHEGVNYTLAGLKANLMKEWKETDKLLTDIIFTDNESTD